MSGICFLVWVKINQVLKENCPLGCPCPNYNCTIEAEMAVLVLSTSKSTNVPILLLSDGSRDYFGPYLENFLILRWNRRKFRIQVGWRNSSLSFMFSNFEQSNVCLWRFRTEKTGIYYMSLESNHIEWYVSNNNPNIYIKVSKVIDCELTRIGDLSFEFYWGACGTFKFPEERIMLCFAETGKTTCERLTRKLESYFEKIYF